MATFGQWLARDDVLTRQDGIGYLARMWQDAEGKRPKVYSPSGIQRFLEKDPTWSDALKAEMAKATAEYHASRGDLMVVRDGDGTMIGARMDALERILTGHGQMLGEVLEGMRQLGLLAAGGGDADLPEPEADWQGHSHELDGAQRPDCPACQQAASARLQGQQEAVQAPPQPQAPPPAGWAYLYGQADHAAGEEESA